MSRPICVGLEKTTLFLAMTTLFLATSLLSACAETGFTAPPDGSPDVTSPDATEPSPDPSEEVPSANPSNVTDLSVSGITDSSVTLAWAEVNDGAGSPASYQVRYALTPIGSGWGEATTVVAGECASPITGSDVGAAISCAVAGLDAATGYDFQLVAFRDEEDGGRVFSDELSNVATATTEDTSDASGVDECAAPDPAWIWCDDFEQDRTGSYFEHSTAGGSFVRKDGVGVGGSAGMRARFRRGQVEAGGLRLAFGRTPQSYFRPVDEGLDDYREVYWRVRVRYQEGWVGGGGDKLSRATVFVAPDSWAQAMIGHVWSGDGENRNVLVLDPASGTDVAGTVRTTRYNDFQNLRWLGQIPGTTPIFEDAQAGRWHCIEAHVRLNTPGRADGVFQLWVDDQLEARDEGLNWVGEFTEYGINAVFLENYWNDGAPQDQERYFDEFVVSTERIGC